MWRDGNERAHPRFRYGMSEIGATNMQQQKRQRGKKTNKPHTITKAVTHIHLLEVNPGKLAALDALAPVYLALCQQYVTCFCTQEQPNAFRDTLFVTPLSERWHRVAIQQAAGIAHPIANTDSSAKILQMPRQY